MDPTYIQGVSSNSIFLSQNIPNILVNKYNLSQAANNFCLHINEMNFFSLHIAIPPGCVDGSFKSFTEKSTGIEYHLCRPFKHQRLGKAINILFDNLWLYHRVSKTKEQNVWFYNVWTGNILSYLLIRFLSHKNTFILLADYNPMRYNNKIGKILLWAIKKAHGVISLSARCYEVNTNFKTIPGIIPDRKINKNPSVFHANKSFLLPGTLNANTGLLLALDVFKNIPEAKLYLSGKLDKNNSKIVEEYAHKYPNIIYKGFYEKFDDYIHLLQSIDYTLSLRNPNSPVNHYNFPSKILETLAYNKIVISTVKYPELDKINYIVVPYSEIDLRESIKKIIDEGESTRIKQCLNNTNILKIKYTETAWIKAFHEMEINK